ncbi:hypothetical protein DM02DRAFT_524441 [Periconia macrospinosa]|uniref:RRM domain-containing protein n=1 Tax=Periconia macrospinosa TaxID=97972 RepID=A0A2V1DUK2_9PLEO|nr:hypothetical protein DM02DRAFT_524441 [Periconia macrospinosa]
MSRGGGTTLYVTGFGHGTRARDLAFEFERYGRLVRCDIPAPRSASSRLFAFVEYENRRDADDAYHEMHNKRIGRDDLLKIEWARTPPSASWRFDSGRDRPRDGGRDGRDGRRGDRDRSPRRGRSQSPRRGRGDGYSPRKDDRRDRYDDRRERDVRDRTRSPDGDREMKDVRDRDDDRERDRGDRGDRAGAGDRERQRPTSLTEGADESPPPVAHDDLDVAE